MDVEFKLTRGVDGESTRLFRDIGVVPRKGEEVKYDGSTYEVKNVEYCCDDKYVRYDGGNVNSNVRIIVFAHYKRSG